MFKFSLVVLLWFSLSAVQSQPSTQNTLAKGRVVTSKRSVSDQYSSVILEEVFKHDLSLAEQGDVGAQKRVGSMYLKGDGVKKDESKALEWYQRAAEQGDVGIQRFLGTMYYLGPIWLEQDYEKARKWYQRAAEQGDAHSLEQLKIIAEETISSTLEMLNKKDSEAQDECHQGSLYYQRGEYNDAITWYKLAARKGDVEAQKRLGEMYLKGIGVAQNNKEAIFWYSQAANQSDVEAQKRLGWIYSELKKDYKEAINWYVQAAEQGDAEAQYNVALIYDKGLGNVVQNDKEAIDWYVQAAEQGHSESQYNLGLKFLKGIGIKKNRGQALHWLRRAAEQGHAKAQNYIAQVSDEELELAEARGFKLDMRLAKEGDIDARLRLAQSYQNGEGVEQNSQEALRLYEEIAEKGNMSAQHKIIKMYSEGEGTPRDTSSAYAWAKVVYHSHGTQNLDMSFINSMSEEEKDKGEKLFNQLSERMNLNKGGGGIVPVQGGMGISYEGSITRPDLRQ